MTKNSQQSSPSVARRKATTKTVPTHGNALRRTPKAIRGQKSENGRVTSVRAFRLGDEYDLPTMRDELDSMKDVLLGRVTPPVDTGISTLMEVAEAFHARAKEMEMHLHRAEADGHVLRGTKHYRFRTGELRSFIELVAKTMELGSRRITATQLEMEMRG